MEIQAFYLKNVSIRVKVSASSGELDTANKIVNQFKSKKFSMADGKWWERTEFNADIKCESFDFWLEQVNKLCAKFNCQPAQDTKKQPPLRLPEVDTDKKDITDVMGKIIQQLQDQVALLQQEVTELKKFDSAAEQELRRLENKNQRVSPPPRSRQ